MHFESHITVKWIEKERNSQKGFKNVIEITSGGKNKP